MVNDSRAADESQLVVSVTTRQLHPSQACIFARAGQRIAVVLAPAVDRSTAAALAASRTSQPEYIAIRQALGIPAQDPVAEARRRLGGLSRSRAS